MSLSSIEMWTCDLIVIMYDCVNKVVDYHLPFHFLLHAKACQKKHLIYDGSAYTKDVDKSFPIQYVCMHFQ